MRVANSARFPDSGESTTIPMEHWMNRGALMLVLHRLVVFGCAVAIAAGRSSFSEEEAAAVSDGTVRRQPDESASKIPLVGRQSWGDVHGFHGWRIQQNVSTKQYRLIDSKGVRHSSGSFEECHATLKKIGEDQKLAPMTGPAVIMIHGLLQSSKCMKDMGTALRDAGYSTIHFDYPSTQIDIPEAAQFLDRFVRSLDGFDQINFVVHSMGGLIVRAYSLDCDDQRIKRMVMLGTPNRGAELADLTQTFWILRTAAGPSARQLGTDRDGLISKLPVPKFEFAVIAGSRGTASGWNPFIPGDDDGTVTVASTKLAGASDFATVPTVHSELLWDEKAIAQTVNFLKNGRLRLDGETSPIRESDTDDLDNGDAIQSVSKQPAEIPQR